MFFFDNIRSFLSTVSKRDLNLLQALTDAMKSDFSYLILSDSLPDSYQRLVINHCLQKVIYSWICIIAQAYLCRYNKVHD